MISSTYGDLGPLWAQLNRYAKELLHRVADGETLSLSEIRAFAEAVLQSQPVALAQAVLEADKEFVIACAVELAASLIVSEVAVDEEKHGSRVIRSCSVRKKSACYPGSITYT